MAKPNNKNLKPMKESKRATAKNLKRMSYNNNLKK